MREITERTGRLSARQSLASHADGEPATALRRAELVNQIARQVVSSLDRDTILPRIVQVLRATFDCYAIVIALVEGDELSFVAGLADERQWLGSDNRRRLEDTGIVDAVARSGQFRLVEDVRAEPAYRAMPDLPLTRSEVAIPLLLDGVVAGVLNLESQRTGAYSMADVELLQALEPFVSLAIRNARQYEQTQRRLEQMALVYQTSVDVAGAKELPVLLHSILEQTARLLGANNGAFALRDAASGELRAVAALEPGAVGRTIAGEVGAAGQVAKTRQPIVIADYLQWEQRLPQMIGGPVPYRSCIIVPVCYRDELLGTLSLSHDSIVGLFTDADARLLSLLANQAAASIQNARLFASLTIEQRKQAELLEHIADAILVADSSGRVISANHAATLLFKRPADQLQGALCAELLQIVDRTRDWPVLLNEVLAQQQIISPREVLALIQNQAEGQRTLAVSLAPMRDNSTDEAHSVIIALWDVTQLAEVEQLRSDIVNTVSHELRMPLTKIKLAVESAELAQRTGRTDVDWRRTVRAETQHLIRLVDNMLRASRIEAGEVQVAAEPVALLPLVRQAIRAYQEPKRFRIQSERRLPLALADRELLQIILNNLFNNAVSYSPAGAPIHVTLAQIDEGCLQICIRDEGAGIPPEKLAHIFERFHRLDQKDARRTYGFGLGLYIARGLIEAQGGTIFARSEPGSGSAFHFTLPVYREDLSHAHPDH